jgi:hypothetical protein
MNEKDTAVLIEAINDLTRVTLAVHSDGSSNREMIRRLHRTAMSPTRIATLLSMAPKDVTSFISKLRKLDGKRKAKGGGKAVARG